MMFGHVFSLNNLLGIVIILILVSETSSPLSSSATTSEAPTILEAIKQIETLDTIEYHMAKSNLEVNVEESLLNVNVGGFRRRFVVEGTIQAGIDLSTFASDHVVFEDATYTIVLPAATLVYCDVDSEVYHQNVNFFLTGVSIEEQAIAEQIADNTALITFRNEAIEDGILDKAEAQAQDIFSSLVYAILSKSANGEVPNIEIEFQQRKENDYPRTCQPEEISGWEYDEGTQRWSRMY